MKHTLSVKAAKARKAVAKSKSKHITARRSRQLKLFVLGYALIILTIGTAVALRDNEPAAPALENPFTLSQISTAQFKLYYPSRLPEGYHFSQPAFPVPQKDVVSLTISAPGSQSLAISQQRLASDIDVEALNKGLGSPRSIDTQYGKASFGTIDQGRSRLANMVTDDKTWILLTAPVSIPEDDVVFILQNVTTTSH